MDSPLLKESYNSIVEDVWQKRLQGMDYTEIRKELQAQSLSADDIKKIIALVNDREFNALANKNNSHGNGSIKSVKWLVTILLLAPALFIIFGFGVVSIPLLVVIIIWGKFYYSNLRR